MYWNSHTSRLFHEPGGLTLTWDVLKLQTPRKKRIGKIWLTLTWDVLKLL